MALLWWIALGGNGAMIVMNCSIGTWPLAVIHAVMFGAVVWARARDERDDVNEGA